MEVGEDKAVLLRGAETFGCLFGWLVMGLIIGSGGILTMAVEYVEGDKCVRVVGCGA